VIVEQWPEPEDVGENHKPPRRGHRRIECGGTGELGRSAGREGDAHNSDYAPLPGEPGGWRQ
jgi:hypothetical protein